MDSFLSMDSIFDDSYDGNQRQSYGAKYNNVATIKITIVKKDYESLNVREVRNVLKWLSGSRVDTWMDMYQVDENNVEKIEYSFLGKVTDIQQYKMDSKTIGFMLTFTSVSPWAFSDLIVHKILFNDRNIFRTDNGILFTINSNNMINDQGVLFNNTEIKYYEDGIVGLDGLNRRNENADTDDMYSFIYVNLEIHNVDSTYFKLSNNTLNNVVEIKNLRKGETILLHDNQFISSDLPGRIFSSDFNFVFPKLTAGINDMQLEVNGDGEVIYTYRFPMKIGDCSTDCKGVIC